MMAKVLAKVAPEESAAFGLDLDADASTPMRPNANKVVASRAVSKRNAAKRRRAHARHTPEVGNSGAAPVVVKEEPVGDMDIKAPLGASGGDGSPVAEALADSGELPPDLLHSFSQHLALNAPVKREPAPEAAVDLSWLDGMDFSGGAATLAGDDSMGESMAAPPVTVSPAEVSPAPPALTRSMSAGSMSKYFDAPSTPVPAAYGDSMPAELPTAAAIGAASTLLPAAALLMNVVAANAAQGGYSVARRSGRNSAMDTMA
jgi:hypothetical protein